MRMHGPQRAEMTKAPTGPRLTVREPTPDRFKDVETIFNARGCSVARQCWCMFYRRSGEQPKPPKGVTRAAANRAALKSLVDAGKPPGLIGYRGKTPVGWI